MVHLSRRLSFSANDSVRKPNAAQCHLLHRTAGHKTPKRTCRLFTTLKCSESTGSGKIISPLGQKDQPQEWNSKRNGKRSLSRLFLE
ncbi:hypothetical protein CEXT_792481 [Caerostris extrusa]|uniref:Uncharacterized protein n=1 Tax=Caerostris extrusa TaxID=172846 RepID=A0AAV4U7E4_CAEEX|nr:hypothetical protein CEXT_792481 [Caerostris extrusa]